MTITAKYASTCSQCQEPVTPGQSIEWERGSKVVRHTTCGTSGTAALPTAKEANKRPADDQPIGAKATYQGRTVYVVARVHSTYSWFRQHMDVVGFVETKDRTKTLVVLAGGRRAEWVPTDALTIVRGYNTAWTFAGMRRVREREENGEGCSYCGKLSCDGARGGHCEED
jgi:hypothetical protein